MFQKVFVLILTVGATEQQLQQPPHWMAPAHQSQSFEAMIAPVHAFQRRLEAGAVAMQSPSPRRLQAIMSTECKEACPGAQDFVMEMMKMMAETTPPPEGTDPMMAMMMSMCDQADTIVCVGTKPECMDGPAKEGDDPAAIKCLCECPDFMTAAAKLGEGDYKPLCSNKAKTVDCVMGKTECASITKEINEDEMTMLCKMSDAGCIEKMNDCKSEGAKWEVKCEGTSEVKADLEAAKDECCPLGKDMMSCNGEDCMKLAIAGMAMDADKGDKEMQKFDNIREVCPDAGLPTLAEAEAFAKASDGGEGDTAADAATGQAALSMAALTAAMIALSA